MQACAELTLGDLMKLEERVEAGTASPAERELHASAKAAVRPFAKKLEYAVRVRVARLRVHMPDRREVAPPGRTRERRATRSRSSSSSRGDPDEPEPPLGRHHQPRAAA